ncbi:hypothetical protein F5I97DRAFT_1812805 [Phlebopus sp. FC_14]|nr:hypothetical protein F5I97DRAFT_1812805 [Phlebopus sp. FC_14]
MPAKKPDYYAVLGLASDASDDAIRTAYKRLALQWHPDRHLKRKEYAAQMFIEVNTAYHALMDGKESTHSSSAETSSTTSVPTSGTNTARSDTNTKDSSRSSSRPPSASSETSSGSSPRPQKPPSTSSDDKSSRTAKPDSKHQAPPSNSSSRGSSHEQKSDSHSRPAKPDSADGQRSHTDRMKSGRKSSKSHDHLRDPPGANTQKTPSSTRSHSSEGLDGSSPPKSPKGDGHSSSRASDAKHGSRPQKTSHSRAGVSHTSKPVIPPSSDRLHKSSRFGLADEFVHKLSKGTTKGRKERRDNLPHYDDIPACGSPLRAINAPRGSSKEWLFPLPLTLDEMYHGTNYRFLVTRELLSRQTEQVEVSIDIPPGIRNGTRIVCPRTGHQRKDGTLQDVVFLVEEVPDERFSRVKDDLYMDVCVPWVDSLADQGGELCIEGMDGEEVTFTLPYPIYDKSTEGQVLVKGAGMPIRDGRKTIGRGDMIIRWQVVFSNQTKWQTFKKALRIKV